MRYAGIYLDAGSESSAAARDPDGFSSQVYKSARSYINSHQLDALRPLRGAPHEISSLRLILTKDSQNTNLSQNIRGEIIMVPFNRLGSKIPIHQSNATIRGTIVICRGASRSVGFSLCAEFGQLMRAGVCSHLRSPNSRPCGVCCSFSRLINITHTECVSPRLRRVSEAWQS